MSDRRIPLAGVIGSPVGGSKLPRLFAYWLRRQILPGHYVPMEVAHGDLAEALRVLPRLGFLGVHVTAPHREAVLGLADHVSDRASLIGAATMLIFQRDGRIHADNTDGAGFIENLRNGIPGWRADAAPVTLLGAGGAARAVVTALIGAGAKEIRIANRTRARSDALMSEFGTRIAVYDWVQAGTAIEGAGTLVNATLLGAAGKQAFRVPLDAISPDMVVCDLVSDPVDTTLLQSARDLGCPTVDGLGMLIHQAAPGFERWFGERPMIDETTRAALAAA